MQITRQRLLQQLVGYIVALMYTFGLALSLSTGQILDIGHFDILKISALALLVLTLLFYNRWTVFASLLVCGAAAFWAVKYRDAVNVVLDAALPFLKSTAEFVLGKEPLPDEYVIPLASILIVLAALFARASAYKLRGCPSMLIFSLGIFLTEWYMGYQNILLPMTFCAAAVATVFAHSYARRLYLKDMSDVEEDYTESDELFDEEELIRHENRTIKIPNASAIALFAVPMALVATLLAASVVPRSPGEYRAKFVEIAIDDVIDYFGQYTGFTRKTYSFSLASLGFTSVTELGGPVYPSKSTAMVVEGIAPSLLKGSTRAVYTGKGWVNPGATGSYRYDGPLWSAKKVDVFDLERPDPNQDEQVGMLFRTVNLTVTPHHNLYTLFSPTRPTSVRSSVNNFIPYFNDIGELFPKHRLDFMERYSVTAKQFVRLTPKIVNYIADLEENLPPEDEEKMDDIRELYLQLPDNLPPSVSSLSSRIVSEHSGKADVIKAMAIHDFFLRNFRYTLTPAAIPPDRDFVEYFLDTREGYCTYYASAMVVLSRAAGIPARYVEGFLLTNMEHDKYTYTVTGENAHAWAELYFEGIGWIPFDATPIGQVQSPSTPTTSVPAEDTFPDIPEPTAPPEEVPIPPPDKKEAKWMLPTVIAVSFILVNLLLILLHRYRYSPAVLERKYGKSGSVRVWWRAILDMLPHQDRMFARRPGETSSMLADRIGTLVQNKYSTFDQVVRIVMRVYYSGENPSDVDLEFVYSYFRGMETRMLKIMTPPVFAVRRIIFPRQNNFRSRKP